MKIPWLPTVLSAANLGLLILLLTQVTLPAGAQSSTVLRGSALEIIDDQGRVRASIGILPSNTAGASETVLFRLIDSAGQPSVKIGASLTTAGLSFVGGDDKSYLILQAENAETTLKMVEPDGRERLISP